MADKISQIYTKAREKGVLTDGLTEDMFREQTKTDEGLRSFYDIATSKGMKFHPFDEFKERFYGSSPSEESTINTISTTDTQDTVPSLVSEWKKKEEEKKSAPFDISTDISGMGMLDVITAKRASIDRTHNQLNKALGMQLFDTPATDLDAAMAMERDAKTPAEKTNAFAKAWGEHTEEGKAALSAADAAFNKKQEEFINGWKHTDGYRELATRLQQGIANKTISEEEANRQLGEAFLNQYGNSLEAYRESLYSDYMNQAQAAMEQSPHKIDVAGYGAQTAVKQNAALSSRIDKEIERRNEEFAKAENERWEKESVGERMLGAMVNDNTLDTRKSAISAELRAAQSYAKQAEDIVEAVRSNRNFFADFGVSFGKTITSADTWDFGVGQLMNSVALKNAADKADKGAPLTKDEELLLEAAANYMAVSMYYSDKVGRGTKAGQTTAASIPFMLEFLLTAGVGSAMANATTRGITRFATRMMGKKMANKAVSIGTEVTGKMIGDLAYAELLTNTFGTPKVIEGTVSRVNGTVMPTLNDKANGFEYAGRVGQQGVGEAFWNAHSDQFIENWSEVIFGGLDPLKKPMAAAMQGSKFFGAIERNAVTGAIIRGWNNPALTAMRKNTRFGGLFEETMEEEVGGLLRLAANTDVNSLKEAGLDLDSQIDIVLGLAPSVLLMNGYGGALHYAHQGDNIRNMRKALETDAERELFDKLMKASRSGEFGVQAHDFIREVVNNNHLPAEVKMELIKGTVVRYRDILSDEVKQADEKVQQENDERIGNEVDRMTYNGSGDIYFTRDSEGRKVCITGGKIAFDKTTQDGRTTFTLNTEESDPTVTVRVIGVNGMVSSEFEVETSTLPNSIGGAKADLQKQFNINYSRALRNGDATFTAGEYVYDTATGAYIGTKEDYEKIEQKAKEDDADVTDGQTPDTENTEEQEDDGIIHVDTGEESTEDMGEQDDTTPIDIDLGDGTESTTEQAQPESTTTPAESENVEPIDTKKAHRQGGIRKIPATVYGKDVRIGYMGKSIYYNADGSINMERSTISIQDERGSLVRKNSERYQEYVNALNTALRRDRAKAIEKAERAKQAEQAAVEEQAAQEAAVQEQAAAEQVAQEQTAEQAVQEEQPVLTEEQQEQAALGQIVAEVEQKHIKKDGTFSEDTTPEQQFVYIMSVDKTGLTDAVTAARESVAQLDTELAELPNNKRMSAANRMLLTKRKQAERQAWIDVAKKYAGEDVSEIAQAPQILPDDNGDANNTVDNSTKMSDEEVNIILSQIENDAEPAIEIELTPDNWVAQFGEDGIIETPIGEVKMGENQYLKLAQKGRNGKLGMIKPTLENPTVVIEEDSIAKDGQETERASSYIFVKSFVGEDGHRTYYFTSITVRKDGREVVVSNQEKERSRIKRLLKYGRLAYIKEATLPSESNTSTQGNQSANPIGDVSDRKGTENNSSVQEQPSENLSETEQPTPKQPATATTEQVEPPVDTTITEPIDLTADDVVLLVSRAKNRTQLARKVMENGEVSYYNISANKKIKASEELSEEPWFEGTKHIVYRKVGNTYVPYIALSTARDLGNRFRGTIVPAKEYNGSSIPNFDTTSNKLYRKTESGKYEQIGNAGKTEADYEGWRNKYKTLDKILDAPVFGDITFWDLLQMWRGNAGDRNVNHAKGTARKTYSSPLDVIKDKLPDADTNVAIVRDHVLELLKVWNWYVKEHNLDEHFANDNALLPAAEAMYRSMREDLYKDEAKQEERTLRIDVPVNDAAGSLTKKNFTNPIYQMMVVLDIAREVSDGKQELIDEQKYPRIEGEGQKNLPKKLRYGFSKANTQKRSAEEILEDINSRYIYTDAAKLKEHVEGLSTQEIKELAQLINNKRNGKRPEDLPMYQQKVAELFANAEGSKAKKNKIRDAIKSNTQKTDSAAEQQKEPMSAEDRKAMQDRMDFLAQKEDFDLPMSDDELEELADLRQKLAEFSIGQAEANPQTAERQLATQVALECLDNAGVKVVQVSDAEREGLFDNAHAQGAEMMAVNDKFNQQLEEYTDENADNIKLDCGFPSKGLLLAGIPDKKIRLNGETLRKKMKSHGFTTEDLKNLPMFLQHPIAVFEGKYPNTYGVLIEMTLNGKNTLVAIDIKNAEIDGFTLVSSVYDKSATSVVTWINKGMMLSVDKTKALRYILTDAPIAPKDNRKGTSDTSIKNEEVISAAKVIQNFDTAKSFGENSSEFQIVYHGSNAMFDRFDHSFMGSGEGAQVFGWGTYVSDVKEIGKAYAKGVLHSTYKGDVFKDADIEDSRDEFDEDEVLFEFIDFARDEIASERNVPKHSITYKEVSERLMEYAAQIEKKYEQTGDVFYLERAEFEKKLAQFVLSDKAKQNLRYGSPTLYEVEIPDNNGSNYLMYEQPIGKDAERIKRALYSELIQADPEAFDSENARKILWNQLNSEFAEDIMVGDVYGNISTHLGSDMAASQFLNSLGYVGLSYPTEYVSKGGNEDGTRNYVIFNERDLDIKDRAELMQRPNGVVYGWAQDGVIYLTKEGLNPNTPIHEYTHLWARAMMQNNPEGWQSIINTFKGTPLWDEVVNDPNYANLTSDDAICSEVLARYSGKRGAARFEKEAGKMIVDGIQTGEIDQVKSLIQRLRDALNKFWDWVGKELFDIKSFDSKESIADRVLYDLVNGTDIGQRKSSDNSNNNSLPDIEFSISPEERAAAQEDWENSLPELFSIDESTKKEMERLSQDVSGSLLRINPASPELYNSSFMRGASNYIAKAFDRTEPIRVMMDNINKWRKANGMPPISGDLDVRTQIESVRSIVANKLHYIEFHQKKELREAIQALAKTVAESEFYQRYKTEKVTDDKGKPIILSPVELIERYLICQDNIERTQMGISRGLPEFTKRMGVDMVQYREEFLEAFGKTDEQREQIKDLWRKIRVMTDIVLDEGLEGGLISEEKYKEMKARKFYIPERDFAEDESKEKDEDEKKKNEIINLSGIRKNRQLEAMKKAEGAESLARSPLAFIEHDVQDAIQKSEENKVKLTMYRLLQENAEWCEAVHMPKPSEVHFDEDGNRVTNAPSREERENMEWIRGQIRMLQAELSAATTEEEKAEIGEAIGELYDQMPYADSYETSELFRGQQKQDPTIVGVYVNGALCEMKFPGLELLANALNNKFDTRGTVKMISKLSSRISAQFTVNNPTFFVVNLARDIPFVLAKGFSEYGIEFEARFSANFAVCQRAVMSYLWNKETGDKQTDKLLQDFLNGGGNMGYSIQEDIAELRADVRKLNPEDKKSTTERVVKGVLTLGYTEMGRVANLLNDYSEIITRFAAYKSVVDMGLGHNEGIKAAHNLSTNFNRKGLGRPFLNLFNSFAMFANATIQGAMGFWRSFDSTKHAMRAVAGFIFVPAFLGFLDTILNPDDDDDEYAISDYDRDNKVILGNFRIPLSEQMKPFWCIGVNIALAMRGRRNAQQIANSMLSSILTNLLPLPQNLTNLPTLLVNTTLGSKDLSPAQIIEQTLLPTMFQNVGQLADNRNFMGGKLRYDIGDIPEYTMADNEAALYKDFAYLAYRISGGDKDIASKHKTDGSGRKVWADINPKQIHAALFLVPSGYMDFVCTAYGLVKSAVTQTPVEDNVRAKDIPIANRFYSSQNPDMFRASVAREARTIITRQDDMMDNYTAQMSKNFALSQQYYKMGLYDKAEQYKAAAEKSKNLIMQENTMEYNVLKGCYEAYKNASIAYTAKQIGMDKKLFKKTYPQFDYEQMEANEKQAVSNLLTAIYIYNGQRVDTKVAKGLQSRYGALTVKDYLDWKDNNTKNK